MASFLDKLQLNTAIDSRTKLDLSSNHITTGSFMAPNIAWFKELVPKEKISVSMETFSRLAPMPVPTFGRANINNRAFFVPFRTIMPSWNDFITDTKHMFDDGTNAIANHVPLVDDTFFTLLFYYLASTDAWGTVVTGFNNTDNLDITLVSSNTIIGIKLNATGRRVLKMLNQLGYYPSWDLNSTKQYSLLPLYAYMKVILDWYWPSMYTDDTRYLQIQRLLTRDVLDEVITASNLTDDTDINLYNTFATILDIISIVSYDSDYFVSAWDNPVSPTAGSYSNVTIQDATVDTTAGAVKLTEDGTPVIRGSLNVATPSNVSTFLVTALKSLTDYMKRHQLVGARALDRYLARFGVQLSADKLQRSVYIGTKVENVQFGDVTATADTADGNKGSQLGNYAGKGLAYGEGNFEFETDEYGIMIIISSIVPVIGYVQGNDRTNQHITKLDFYTPEFDNLGVQPILSSELYQPAINGMIKTAYLSVSEHEEKYETISNYKDQVFGFTPRYSEYKIARDRLTGDYTMNSINTGQESWNMFRLFDYDDYSQVKHNVNFVRGVDKGQYDRIFYNTDADYDKFNLIYNFNVVSYSPMKSLYDTYEFEDKGQTVTEDVNGVKMN